MSRVTWPNWIRRAFDDHFNVLSRLAAENAEVELLRQKLDGITAQLKSELSEEQFQLILDWEGSINYHHAVEKEWFYLRGLQNGMILLKELYSFMSDD